MGHRELPAASIDHCALGKRLIPKVPLAHRPLCLSMSLEVLQLALTEDFGMPAGQATATLRDRSGLSFHIA
jgi:hypothetical protein